MMNVGMDIACRKYAQVTQSEINATMYRYVFDYKSPLTANLTNGCKLIC